MTEVKRKDDTFTLPESHYDIAKLTDYYTRATERFGKPLPKSIRSSS